MSGFAVVSAKTDGPGNTLRSQRIMNGPAAHTTMPLFPLTSDKFVMLKAEVIVQGRMDMSTDASSHPLLMSVDVARHFFFVGANAANICMLPRAPSSKYEKFLLIYFAGGIRRKGTVGDSLWLKCKNRCILWRGRARR